MNSITIVAALLSLIVGGAAGISIERNHGLEKQTPIVQSDTENHVAAADYLAMRPGIEQLPIETLSTEETTGLLLMREEEKFARDVYQTLYEQYNLTIFKNIAQSEQTHTEAVRTILEKYNITDPVTDDSIGVFQSDMFQTLYNDLIAQGSQSITAALTVGATIEDLDINDLQNLRDATDNADIALVYDNLERGSRNHLRAFVRQLERQGGSYEPQYITEAYYAEIIAGAQETGNGMQQGGNSGQGSNNGNSIRGWGGGRQNR